MSQTLRVQASARNPELAKQLDLLLTSDRSTEMLMDKTFNLSSVITSDNIEELIADMKQNLISEKTAEFAGRMKAEKHASRQAIKEVGSRSAIELGVIEGQKANTISENDRLISTLTSLQSEDLEAVDQFIINVNDYIKKEEV